jgi:NTP pyrophosphatase (non-canonical NTP hydrolase)
MTERPTDLDWLANDCLADSERWFPHLHEHRDAAVIHMALGLAGEAGELANLVKKANRDGSLKGDGWGTPFNYGAAVPSSRQIADEAVDCILYALLIIASFGYEPSDLITAKREFNNQRFTGGATHG